jgi:Chaperone of endosialidase
MFLIIKNHNLTMKKITFIITFMLLVSIFTSVSAQLRVRSDAFIQIGYDSYRTLSIGGDANGKFAIEYWAGMSGMNFWKPWPTSNASDFNLFLRDDGNAGIGTSGSSSFKLDVAGVVRCTGIDFSSDRRLKANIKPIESGLSKILKLSGVTYKYNFEFDKYNGLSKEGLSDIKTKTMDNDPKIKALPNNRIGLIAQDVQTIVPEVINKDEKGYLSINYIDLIPLLIEAIKEQNKQIETLETKLTSAAVPQLPQTTSSESKITSRLYNNAPNPFNNNTIIKYSLLETNLEGECSISIYNQQGILMTKQVIDKINGDGQVEIKGDVLKDGVYFYALVVNNKVVDNKMMLKISSK